MLRRKPFENLRQTLLGVVISEQMRDESGIRGKELTRISRRLASRSTNVQAICACVRSALLCTSLASTELFNGRFDMRVDFCRQRYFVETGLLIQFLLISELLDDVACTCTCFNVQ